MMSRTFFVIVVREHCKLTAASDFQKIWYNGSRRLHDLVVVGDASDRCLKIRKYEIST